MAKHLPQASSARCTPQKMGPGTWPTPIGSRRYMWPTCTAPRGPRVIAPSTCVAWSVPGQADRMPRPSERPATEGGARTPRSSHQKKWRMNAESLLMQSEIYRRRGTSTNPSPNGQVHGAVPDHEQPWAQQEPSSPSCLKARPASALSPKREIDETAQIAATLALHIHEPQERQASSVDEVALEDCGGHPENAVRPAAPATQDKLPEAKPRQVCALAESAAAYRERRRQADAIAELELQELIKKTAVRTAEEEQESSGENGGDAPMRVEGPQSIAEVYALCKQMSEAFLLPISEVKACYEDFRNLDADGNFALSVDEFEQAVRKNCHLREDEPLPANLAVKYAQMDHDGNRLVDFKEYVRWSQGASWSEHLLVRDERDRESRKLAKKLGIHLLDIERLRRLFDIYDVERRRVITQEMFTRVIQGILKVTEPSDIPKTRLDRYWREIDLDRNGTVDFEEFVIWMIDRGPEHLMLRREWISQTLGAEI